MRKQSNIKSNELCAIIKGKVKFYLLAIFSFFCAIPAFLSAQYQAPNTFSIDNYYFESFQLPGGKLENIVQCIAQDSTGFLWFGTQKGLVKYDGRQFVQYFSNPLDSNSLGSDYIESIYVDADGILWVGAFKNGFTKFNPTTNQFKRYYVPGKDGEILPLMGINAILKYQDYIWLGTHNGLHRFDPKTESFNQYFFQPEKHDIYNANVIRELYIDKADVFWVGMGFTWSPNPTNGGLYKYQPEEDNFIEFRNQPTNKNSISDNRVKAVFEDSKNNFWIGTMGDGLNLMDRQNNHFTSFPYDHKQPQQLSRPVVLKPIHRDKFFNQVQVIREDQDNQLWIGGFNGGLNIYNPERKQQIHFEKDINGLETNVIWDIFESEDKAIFIATGGDGEGKNYKVKINRDLFSFYTIEPNTIIRDIIEDENQHIWLGGSNGLNLRKFIPSDNSCIPLPQILEQPISSLAFTKSRKILTGHPFGITGKFKSKETRITDLSINPFQLQAITTATIECIKEDKKGNIWIGTWGNGLYRFNPQTNKVDSFKHKEGKTSSIGGDHISAIFEDSKGNIWVAGGKESIVLSFPFFMDRLDPIVDTFKHYYQPDEEYGNAPTIAEDKLGNLWYPTFLGGIHQLNTTTGEIKKYNQGNSLIPTDDIRALVIDANDNLWMSTEKTIVRLTPNRESFIQYTHEDGVKIHSFESGSGYISKDSTIYFGGVGGFHYFKPEQILSKENTSIPKIIISDFSVKNLKPQSAEEPILETAIWHTKSIDLSHQQNTFSIGFTCIDYHAPEEVYLEYKLENQDPDWLKADDRKTANYYNLRPGEYLFKVRGVNSKGIWNKTGKQLSIIIHPPWWQTTWAYLLFFVVITSLVYALYQYQLKQQLAIQETKRLAELDETKSRLYTNITHEFRTPLTVMLGMTNRLNNYYKQRNSFRFQEAISMINRNGEQLLNLVNQLLDLSKIESNAMQIDMEQGDIVSYIKYLFESFHSFAESKNIRMHFSRDMTTFLMDFDKRKIQHIISNVLSNAIKFTPSDGMVNLHISHLKNEKLVIKVQDSGIGISKEKMPFIFDRFYQTDNTHTRKGEGTGIGLALVKELVHLLNGTVEAKSILKEGTTFTISLPVTNNATIAEHSAHQVKVPTTWATNLEEDLTTSSIAETPAPYQLLIVEDNTDVIAYLKACLQNHYQLVIAQNGQEGIDKAIELIPDIIISDVMMPEKDGFELCDTLKQDSRTSHIPIILLTAKATTEDRLTGLKRGADAYLSKPFEPEELAVRLQKLIEIRKKLQLRYATGISPAEKIVELETEDAFVLQVQAAILEDLDSENFKVDDLAKKVFLSRSQLHRKIKALTGQSTSEFRKAIRLKTAKKLIETTTQSISIISMEVGYKNVSNFSNDFKKLFNAPPSSFRN